MTLDVSLACVLCYTCKILNKPGGRPSWEAAILYGKGGFAAACFSFARWSSVIPDDLPADGIGDTF
ncbi:MAG: hypothetical protein HFH26_12905 [Clostridiaceae bacterium]|nr:hypothetical protein [Clostridiaceae bacterium]